jgi:hypothetical protein
MERMNSSGREKRNTISDGRGVLSGGQSGFRAVCKYRPAIGKGDKICIIEAKKLMNEIPASGTSVYRYMR